MNRALKAVAIATTAVMYLVLQMGALVTNTDSGTGCGASWPLCKGTFMPDWDYNAIIEFSHRAVSGAAGLLTVLLAVWIWRAMPRERLLKWMSASAVFFVCLQGGLGAAQVMWPQPGAVLALHFGISLVCLSATFVVTMLLFRMDRKVQPAATTLPAQLKRWVWFVAIFNYGVVYLGAFVRHRDAAGACMGWPLCNGQLIPPLHGLVGAAFIHRVAAALAVLLIIRTAVLARRWAPGNATIRRAADLAVAFILLQVASGALFAFWSLNLVSQSLHSAIVGAFWCALTAICLEVSRQPVSQEAGAPIAPQAHSSAD